LLEQRLNLGIITTSDWLYRKLILLLTDYIISVKTRQETLFPTFLVTRTTLLLYCYNPSSTTNIPFPPKPHIFKNFYSPHTSGCNSSLWQQQQQNLISIINLNLHQLENNLVHVPLPMLNALQSNHFSKKFITHLGNPFCIPNYTLFCVLYRANDRYSDDDFEYRFVTPCVVCRW